MESQPQNPEFRNNPENFHPCIHSIFRSYLSDGSPKDSSTGQGSPRRHLKERAAPSARDFKL